MAKINMLLVHQIPNTMSMDKTISLFFYQHSEQAENLKNIVILSQVEHVDDCAKE